MRRLNQALVAKTSKITESCASTADMSETCIVCASRNDMSHAFLRKARWMCYINFY